jgi:hypothetical protein
MAQAEEIAAAQKEMNDKDAALQPAYYGPEILKIIALAQFYIIIKLRH